MKRTTGQTVLGPPSPKKGKILQEIRVESLDERRQKLVTGLNSPTEWEVRYLKQGNEDVWATLFLI
jgi:hypothetical protein